jgi:HlyD family secretion protein
MTATADITVKKVEDALLAPNAALRFTPPVTEKKAPSSGGSLISQLLPRRPGQSGSKKREEVNGDKKQQRVWVWRDGQPVAVPVSVGATDGIMTEVKIGDIEPGMPLVVDTVRKDR